MKPRAAVIGTGFVGVVHVEALRRIGVEVVGVLGSTPERAAAKAAAAGLPAPYPSLDALLADDRVDVVHVATPNHLHVPQVRAALAAGKHVVCEKPLATTAADSAALLREAEASGLVHCTNFNLRYYPLVQHARALVASGELGRPYHAQGGYLQDWLLLDTDWNWRLDPAAGGELRAISDIGSHWIDLLEFVSGLRVEAVMAELSTHIPVRRRPVGEVETFGASSGERVAVDVATEDAAHVLLRLSDGGRAAMTVSQIAAGRRNHLAFEIDCSAGSVAWNSERNEELFIGRRGRPNEVLLKDVTLLAPPAAAVTSYPPGHAEGYPDTFKHLYAAVYAAAESGRMPAEPTFPTFAAGHRANVIGEAIGRSAAASVWVDI
jgi:predicted dehydrogenase